MLFRYFLILLSSQQAWLIISRLILPVLFALLPLFFILSVSQTPYWSPYHLLNFLAWRPLWRENISSPGQMPNQTHPSFRETNSLLLLPRDTRFIFWSRDTPAGSHPCFITTLQSSSSYVPLYHSPYTVAIYRSKQHYKCNLRMFQCASFIKVILLNSVWVNLIFVAIGPTNPRKRSLAQVSYSVAFYFSLLQSFSVSKLYQSLYLSPEQWIPTLYCIGMCTVNFSLSLTFATSKGAQ